MLADLLKVLELLLKALQGEHAADKKRVTLAKQLLALHRDMKDLIDRDRQILALLQRGDTLVHTGLSVSVRGTPP